MHNAHAQCLKSKPNHIISNLELSIILLHKSYENQKLMLFVVFPTCLLLFALQLLTPSLWKTIARIRRSNLCSWVNALFALSCTIFEWLTTLLGDWPLTRLKCRQRGEESLQVGRDLEGSFHTIAISRAAPCRNPSHKILPCMKRPGNGKDTRSTHSSTRNTSWTDALFLLIS